MKHKHAINSFFLTALLTGLPVAAHSQTPNEQLSRMQSAVVDQFVEEYKHVYAKREQVLQQVAAGKINLTEAQRKQIDGAFQMMMNSVSDTTFQTAYCPGIHKLTKNEAAFALQSMDSKRLATFIRLTSPKDYATYIQHIPLGKLAQVYPFLDGDTIDIVDVTLEQLNPRWKAVTYSILFLDDLELYLRLTGKQFTSEQLAVVKRARAELKIKLSQKGYDSPEIYDEVISYLKSIN